MHLNGRLETWINFSKKSLRHKFNREK